MRGEEDETEAEIEKRGLSEEQMRQRRVDEWEWRKGYGKNELRK